MAKCISRLQVIDIYTVSSSTPFSPKCHSWLHEHLEDSASVIKCWCHNYNFKEKRGKNIKES